MAKKKQITIADLYPWMTQEEQEEAKYNLKRYLEVVWKIYLHLREKNGGKTPIWLKRLVWARKKREKIQRQHERTIRRLEKSRAHFARVMKVVS